MPSLDQARLSHGDPYAAFRGFLQKRLPDQEAAEDVLQQNLLKALVEGSWTEKENPSAWFYRVLRNAVADYYRTRASQARRDEGFAREPLLHDISHEELADEACVCFRELLPVLKPEYSDLLKTVDLGGKSPADAAREAGITYNNLMVRLHRARGSLRSKLQKACGICSEHGCLNCTCSPASPPTA